MIKYKNIFRFYFCEWGIEDEIYDQIKHPDHNDVDNTMETFQMSQNKKLFVPKFHKLVEQKEQLDEQKEQKKDQKKKKQEQKEVKKV